MAIVTKPRVIVTAAVAGMLGLAYNTFTSDSDGNENEADEMTVNAPKPATDLTDIDELERIREEAKKRVDKSADAPLVNACFASRKKVANSAKTLAEAISGEQLHDITYTCPKETLTLDGHVVLGFTLDSSETDKTIIGLTPLFFEPTNPCRLATALYTLAGCAKNDTCMAYTGPGSYFYPGGEVGRDAETFYQKCDDYKAAEKNEAKKKATEVARPPTEFNKDSVASATDTKGKYTDDKGGTLEGQFTSGFVKGTYRLGAATLEGTFKIGGDSEVLPNGQITIHWTDDTRLSCNFLDGLTDSSSAATFTSADGQAKTLRSYLDAKAGGSWYEWLRDTSDPSPLLKDYRLDNNYRLTIKEETREAKGPE